LPRKLLGFKSKNIWDQEKMDLDLIIRNGNRKDFKFQFRKEDGTNPKSFFKKEL